MAPAGTAGPAVHDDGSGHLTPGVEFGLDGLNPGDGG